MHTIRRHQAARHTTRLARQRGFSLLGLIFFGGLIAIVGLVFAQALPTMLEYQAARKAIEKAKTESTIPAVRAAFDRSAAIDNMPSLTGKDLVVVKGQKDNFVVSFAYNREIHLAGPAHLLLKYAATTQ